MEPDQSILNVKILECNGGNENKNDNDNNQQPQEKENDNSSNKKRCARRGYQLSQYLIMSYRTL